MAIARAVEDGLIAPSDFLRGCRRSNASPIVVFGAIRPRREWHRVQPKEML
jgi:hypothetical protein